MVSKVKAAHLPYYQDKNDLLPKKFGRSNLLCYLCKINH